MIDKDYLRRLKDEDYIAWHELTNDPMLRGTGTGDTFILPVIVLIIAGAILYTLIF